MLEFWKDGKRVEVRGIYHHGRVGQIVVCDNVSYGETPDLEKHPLARYPQPAFFVIVERVDGPDGYYIVRDSDGLLVTLKSFVPGFPSNASEPYLYDVQEWAAWQMTHTAEKLSRKARRIEILETQVDTLKDVLIRQGLRVITPEQAKTLGID